MANLSNASFRENPPFNVEVRRTALLNRLIRQALEIDQKKQRDDEPCIPTT